MTSSVRMTTRRGRNVTRFAACCLIAAPRISWRREVRTALGDNPCHLEGEPGREKTRAVVSCHYQWAGTARSSRAQDTSLGVSPPSGSFQTPLPPLFLAFLPHFCTELTLLESVQVHDFSTFPQALEH